MTSKFSLITTIKLHRPLYLGIVTALEQIFTKGFYADKVIERLFKANKQWGSRDRALIAETIYDMVRHWRLINELAGHDYQQYQNENAQDLLQIYFCFIKKQKIDFLWTKPIDETALEDKALTLKQRPEIWFSVSDWMHKIGANELKNEWNAELQALNNPAPLVVRVNTLKTSKQNVIDYFLRENKISYPSVLANNALIFDQRFNVFSSEAFKNGWIEVQDEGSQVIGEFCKVKPGMRIIDACAGAGGKTLELAALAQNKGKIIAMDVEQWKLEELKKRAKRAGAFNIEPRLIEGSKTIKKLEHSADLVLLDVPCSGTGVLRRNPDAKWKLNPEFFESVKNTQQEIITSYSKMVKPGGRLIYSTCSIFPSENGEQVRKFLDLNPDFSLEEEVTLSPSKNGTDGFYMARLLMK